jgi:hypothetical protein
MKGIRASTPRMPWEDGSLCYGHRSLYGGRPLVHVKVLSDRRTVGGGIACLLRLSGGIGSWGGCCLSMGDYVAGMGATSGAGGAGGR